MKKLYYPFWIFPVLFPVIISCELEEIFPSSNFKKSYSNVQGELYKTDITQLEGVWGAYYCVLKEENGLLDVTEHFEEFKLSINKNQSCCNYNGCESWVTSSNWEINREYLSNYFINRETGNIMFMDVQTYGPEKVMTAEIHIGEPGFSFVPEDKTTGDFIIELIFESNFNEDIADSPQDKKPLNNYQ